MSDKPIIQVAIADDHPLVRHGFASLVKLTGNYNVCIEADNGADLLSQINNLGFLPDICIVDINMPVMDGYQTILELRSKYPTIRTLAVTIYEDDHNILRMYNYGVNGYLFKSSSIEAIRAALKAAYEKQFYYPEEISNRFPKITDGKIAEYNKRMLTETQLQFLSHCCSAKSYEEISNEMCLSRRTVEKYQEKISRKIGVQGRLGLGLYALWSGIGKFPSKQ